MVLNHKAFFFNQNLLQSPTTTGPIFSEISASVLISLYAGWLWQNNSICDPNPNLETILQHMVAAFCYILCIINKSVSQMER